MKLTHLRVFGCVAYINDQGRNKLDPKSKKCTFIGYGENEFGYHLWDNENQKMICSRDLIFNERVMYRDRNDTHTSNPEKSGPIYVEVDDVPKTPIVESPQLEESTEHSSDNNLIDQNLLLQVLYWEGLLDLTCQTGNTRIIYCWLMKGNLKVMRKHVISEIPTSRSLPWNTRWSLWSLIKHGN